MVIVKNFVVWSVLFTMSILLPELGLREVNAAYPEKPISFIVPFGAGGGFDLIARAVAVRLEKELAIAVVIKNVPGAGGRRGSITLYKSKPDGYTIGFAHFVPFQTDEILLGRKPSIDYRKFAMVLKLTQSKHYVYVGKKTPYKSLADLKNAGRPIKFAGTGVGAITWVEGHALGATVGFPVKFVTGYGNLPKAALAVARGDADAGVGSYHHFQGVKKDLRPIVFLAAKRDFHYPDVPSISELGYPRLAVLGSPRAVAAPPGTPEERLKVIRKALLKIIRQPDFVKWAEEAGYFLDPEEPEGLRKTLKLNADIYRGLKPLMKKATGK